MAEMPQLMILSGPNGAGKTTCAATLLPEVLGIREFVNADTIARGLSGFNPESVALEAGRILLTRLRELAEARQNFAFETTLASRSYAPWVAGLRATGYCCHLTYLWLPNPDIGIERVQQRVQSGGHHVPPEVVTRRYWRGLHNFFTLYQQLAAAWWMYNGGVSPPCLVACRMDGVETIPDPNLWQQIQESLSHVPSATNPE